MSYVSPTWLALAAMLVASDVKASEISSPQYLLDRFGATYEILDDQAVSRLFEPNAVISSCSKSQPFRGPEGAQEFFHQAWAGAERGPVDCDPVATQQLGPTMASFTTICRLAQRDKIVALRLSGTAALDAEEWRFTELHVAAQRPQP